MLKKLVKYGNSNALVLDKAILELLNIGEGAILKISTDGKSIILTPQKMTETQQVCETYNSDQAWLDVAAQETAKLYKISEKDTKRLIDLYRSLKDCYSQLSNNADYLKELSLLRERFTDTTSPVFIEAFKILRSKFSPDLVKIENEINSFETVHNLAVRDGYKSTPLSDDQKSSMQQEFAAIFTKHANAFVSYHAFLNNPDYQHEVQLIAEKYKDNKNSTEYMEAIEKVQNRYSPETEQLRNELKAIGKKYSTVLNV